MGEKLVKGIILKSRLDFLEATYGPDALESILPHLKGKAKEVFSEPKKIRATSWYDFDINIEVDKVICEVLANGDTDIFRRLGAFTNQFQTTSASKHAYHDPWKYLALHVGVLPRFWKPGRAELVKVNDGEAVIRVYDLKSNRDYCLTNLGFFQTGLELSGARNVVAEETMCTGDPGPHCEYRFTFEWP